MGGSFTGGGFFHAGGASSFSPDSLASLVLWLKADSGVTQAGSVSAWANQAATGSTYNASQATSSFQPAFVASAVNGLPCASFDGTNDRLTLGENIALSGDFTITMMCQPEYASSQPTYVGGDTTGAYIREYAFNQTEIRNDAGTVAKIDLHSPLDSHEHTVTFVRSGSTITRYVDGIQDGSVTLGGTLTVNTVGWFVSGTAFKGRIYEVMIFNAALTTEQRKSVENYTRQKYNVGTKIIVFASESTTQGTGSGSVNSADSYPARLMTLLKANGYHGYVAFNEAIAGTLILDANTRAGGANGIDNKDYFAPPMLIAWLGGNDIGAGNASTVISRYVTYLNGRKTAAANYTQIFGANLYAAKDTPSTAAVNAWNSVLATAAAAPSGSLYLAGLTGLANLMSNPELADDGDYNNATYYQVDKFHLTGNGNQLVAQTMFNLIQPYLVA